MLVDRVEQGPRLELVMSPLGLHKWRAGWDALAVEAGLPYCSPDWMLSWWEKAAPEGSELRVAIATEGDELLGIAPFFLKHRKGDLATFRLLGSGKSMPIEPLAKKGLEPQLASAFAGLLWDSWPRPDVITFEGVSVGSPWPELFRSEWPSSPEPWRYTDVSRPSPAVNIANKTFEEWFSSKTKNFRQQMRRSQRQLEKKGAVSRLITDPDELGSKLESFAGLHHQRWDERGGSHALNQNVEAMLREAGRRMIGSGRFQLWTIEVEGRDISSHLFVRAGGELAYWLGGFDSAWASQHPSMVSILDAIEHGFETGVKRVNLGAGGRPYKYRFSDEADTLDWVTLAPRKGRYPITRLQLLPRQVGRAMSNHMSPATRSKLKSVLRSTRRSSDR